MKFYDQIARTYDFFIDWQNRIKREDPFYQHLFRERLAKSILDLGCGTGGHAMHWAEMGYNVIGIDSSKEMIAYAKQMSEERDIDIEFQCMRLNHFATPLQQEFDTIICVGNTISHILERADLLKLFQESVNALKETGIAVFHTLNYRRIVDVKKRDFPVISRTVGDNEYVFIRFYDFLEQHLEFNYVVACRENGEWSSRSHQLKHHPWMKDELISTAKEAGFTAILAYGGYDFSEFDLDKSDNLLLVCELGEVD